MSYVEHTFPCGCPSFLLFIKCQSCKPSSIHKLETNLKAYHIHDTTQRKTLFQTTLTTLFHTKNLNLLTRHITLNPVQHSQHNNKAKHPPPTKKTKQKKTKQNKQTNKQSEATQNPTQRRSQQTPTTTTLPRSFLCYMQTHQAKGGYKPSKRE